MELLKFFAKFIRIDADSVPTISVRSWIEQELHDPMVRHIVYAMLRVGSFTLAPDHQMAGPVLGHVARTSKKNSIVYVQGGWQTIVDQLYAKADRAGVTMVTGTNVMEIGHDGTVRKIKFADGKEMNITHVISATPPEVTCRLLGNAVCKSVFYVGMNRLVRLRWHVWICA